MKKYRFFFHFRRSTGQMTVHFRGKCIPVKNVICNTFCETKWNQRQPYLVMQGFCTNVTIIKDKAYIH